VALAAPQDAGAHLRTGLVAVDYRASVVPFPGPLREALAVRVYESDRALRLSVRAGHSVLVRGYFGEPLLRLDAAGTAVNEASLTAAGVGLLRHARAPDSTGPVWRHITDARTIVWHDARLRRLAPGVERRTWTVPVVVDGHPFRLEGEVWRVGSPSPWPWLVVGVPFLVLTIALLLARQPRVVRVGAAGLGVAAIVSLFATESGFAFDTYASAGKWIEAGNAVVLGLVGLGVVARGSPDAKGMAGGALGALALSLGLTAVPVFVHGVVLSILPAAVTRFVAGVTISSGAAASILGLAVFAGALERHDPAVYLSRK
jgi:hypothetical protein